MKILSITLISSLLFTFAAKAQQDGCPPSLRVISLYYKYQPSMQYGAGFEAGMQGTDSKTGFFAGYYFGKLRSDLMKSDSPGSTRGSMYVKGTYRFTEPGSAGAVFLTIAPELSVQSGADVSAGFRVMLPLSPKKGFGIEPQYSIKRKEFSLNIIASF